MEARIKQVVANQLGCNESELVPEARLVKDLGADDLDIAELQFALEDEFSIIIDDELVDKEAFPIYVQ